MIAPTFWWKNHRPKASIWTTSKLDQSILHRHRKSLIWILAWWLLGSCGWWDPKEAKVDIPAISSSEVTDLESTRMKIASVSIWSIPTSAPFEVEGKLGYGWIYFEHPISWYANGPYVNPYQSSSYNPRDVLSRLGSTEWIIVRASFSYELDRDNNGVIDSSWTPLNTSWVCSYIDQLSKEVKKSYLAQKQHSSLILFEVELDHQYQKGLSIV